MCIDTGSSITRRAVNFPDSSLDNNPTATAPQTKMQPCVTTGAVYLPRNVGLPFGATPFQRVTLTPCWRLGHASVAERV